jgi:hypothetical protein
LAVAGKESAMRSGKYGRYVVEKPLRRGLSPWDSYHFYGAEDYKTDVTFFFLKVAEPCVMEEFAHAHDFDMYLHFMSYDPDHMDELNADIEMCLGPEEEVHRITTPCSVFIPKGMVHCPLVFKRVTTPVFFFHTSIAPEYSKVEEVER